MTPPPIIGWAVVWPDGLLVGRTQSKTANDAFDFAWATLAEMKKCENWVKRQIAAGARAYRAELRVVDDEAQIVPLGYVAMPRNRQEAEAMNLISERWLKDNTP